MPIPAEEQTVLRDLLTVRYSMSDLIAALEFDQLIRQPAIEWTPTLLEACNLLFDEMSNHGDGWLMPESAFNMPKWIFLEFVADKRRWLLHGSADGNIAQFEPRVAGDNLEGSETPRVYAASNAILAMFYAIVDRARLEKLDCIPAINNVYVTRMNARGEPEARFQFALDYRALPHFPWRSGFVYLIPPEHFTPDAGEEQWFSESPVRPTAIVGVSPQDWPLLADVRGMDFIEFLRRSNRSLSGCPWWPDPAVYPHATLVN